MNLTVKLKLLPTEEQKQALLSTMRAFNNACNYVSEIAFTNKMYSKFKLQKIVYYHIRECFNLSSQMAVRVVGKVTETYKVDKSVQHHFSNYSAMVYDDRIMTIKGLERVSLLVLGSRIIIPFVFGEYAQLKVKRIRGQSDLIYKNNNFYLCVVVDVPEPDPINPKEFLGVDLGIINLATTSDGEIYSGEQVNNKRIQIEGLKSRLQSKKTKSSKRHLKKLSGRERRFKSNINHIISKKIVSKAKALGVGIALEDLTYFKPTVNKPRKERSRYGKWAFSELKVYVEYKSKLSGIPVVTVDPCNTSRECSKCGYTDKKNRLNQSEFKCISCGYESNADLNASFNISKRAKVTWPIVSSKRIA